MPQHTNILIFHKSITSPFRGSRDGVAYKFSAKEKDEETSYSYFGARYLASEFSLWLSVDPMADKYPSLSSYMYCAGNPVIYFDPDGKEKVIWVENNNKSKDATIYKAASNAKDNNEAIHIYAHGSPNGITANINGKEINIRNAKQFDEVMKETSNKWKNRKEGENLIVILHSCRTGRETKNGDDSFAEELSKDNSFKNVTFVAPDERDYFSSINGEIGPYKAKYADKNGDYNKFNNDGTPNKEMSNNKGNWRVFRNGKEILKVYGSTVLLNPNNNIKNEKE